MEFLQKSIQDLSVDLRNRMAAFEEAQKNNPETTASASSLSVEYAAFKSLVAASLSNLQRQIDLLAQDADRQEMRSRRKMLLVHGVREARDEDAAETLVTFFKERLSLSGISKADISRCHRLGRAGGDKPRPILVKFCSESTRDEVWFSKTKLKASGITLSEFLTKARHELFMEARQRFGVTKCWTREGTVYVMRSDGSRRRVTSLADLGTPQPAAAVAVHVAGPRASSVAAPASGVQAQEKTRRRVATKK